MVSQSGSRAVPCKERRKRAFAWVLLAVFGLIVPFVRMEGAYALASYYCAQCGAELSYSEASLAYIHPESACTYSGSSANLDTSQAQEDSSYAWVTTDVADAGDSEETSEKQPVGKAFVLWMLESIMQSGDSEEDGFLSPRTLLSNSFNWLIGEFELDGESQDGIIDAVTASDWYLFLVGVCFVVQIFRFCYDYALEKVWDWGRISEEQFYRPFFTLVGSMVFIALLPQVMKLGLLLSQGAVEVVADNNVFSAGAADTSETLERMEEALVDGLGFSENGGITNIGSDIGAMVQGVILLILPWGISCVSAAALFLCIIQRVLEIAVRAALMPLAMTDIYKGGDRSHGFQYVLQFFGLCFQGVAIIIVYFVADYVSLLVISGVLAEFDGDGLGLSAISQITLMMAGIQLAKTMLVFKTASLAKGAFS